MSKEVLHRHIIKVCHSVVAVTIWPDGPRTALLNEMARKDAYNHISDRNSGRNRFHLRCLQYFTTATKENCAGI